MFADLKQNAPGRGRTPLFISVVIEAMITLLAVWDNTRIGLVRQSLLPGIERDPRYFNGRPGRETMPLSIEPPKGVRDKVLRVLFTLKHKSLCLGFGPASLNGVEISAQRPILELGKLHRFNNNPSGQVGE